MHSAVHAVCPSVCLSVRLSQPDVMSTLLNVSPKFFYHLMVVLV